LNSTGAQMSEDRNHEEKFNAQTAAQFESLGRFVQAFELMVDAVRTSCYFFLSRGDGKLGQLLNVVLYHQSMTAGPLFEIVRGIYAIMADNYPEVFNEEEKRTITSVLRYCAKEYSALLELRNGLLHGTWRIGWASVDQKDFSEMVVHKFKVSGAGYKLVDLPKSADELNAHTSRCESVMTLIYRIYGACMTGLMSGTESRVRFNIREENGRWLPEPPVGPS
jgi:hypothetical protein